jgi:hypothetical protein
LHDQHVIENENLKNDILLNVGELVKNDLWCICYYQHRMNNFQKLFNVLFGEIQDYFLQLNFKVED